MNRSVTKPVVLILVALAGLSVAGWYAVRQLPASISYGIRAEFESVPESDTQFEEWMRSQPGVVEERVHVARRGNSVGVIWIMTRTVGGDPPVPDFRAAFERFGYRGLVRLDYDWRGGDWPDQK